MSQEFTLEKHRVVERLDALERVIQHLTDLKNADRQLIQQTLDTMQHTLTTMRQLLTKHDETLYGDGQDWPGLVAGQRELHGAKNSDVWWRRGTILALIVAAINAVFAWFRDGWKHP